MTYLFFAGLAAVVAGAALIYPPAALIAGGAIVSAVAYRLSDA